MTMVATVGNAPGQRQTVTVSGEHMQLHGVCVGTGSMIVDANGPGGQFTENIGCAGSWSLTNGFPVAGLAADSPTDRSTVKVLLCGDVKQWAADVLGNGAVAADQSPTVEPMPPSCTVT